MEEGTMITAQLSKKLPRTFQGLAEILLPHAIENNADLMVVIEVADRLAVLDHRTTGQEKYLQTLSQLIEAYEADHHPIDTSALSPLQVLKSFVKAHNMTASALGRLLGSRDLGSKILRGERELSKANIRVLADFFKVSTDL